MQRSRAENALPCGLNRAVDGGLASKGYLFARMASSGLGGPQFGCLGSGPFLRLDGWSWVVANGVAELGHTWHKATSEEAVVRGRS